MLDWDGLDRRQQLWLLDRQEEGLVEALGGRSRADVAAAIGVGPAALSPSILLTTPLPPVLLAKLAFELGVPADRLHPLNHVPDPEEAEYRSDPGLAYVMEGPDGSTAEVDPDAELGEALRQTALAGTSRIDLARACGLGYSSYSKLERRSGCLTRRDAARVRTVLSKRPVATPAYAIESADDGMVRIRVAARMRAGAALRIAQALGTSAETVPTGGPYQDAVALRLDVLVPPTAARAFMEIISPSPRPRRLMDRIFRR